MSERSRTTEAIGESQLRLLPGGSVPSKGSAKGSTRPDWQLDERTRSVGRLGVAQAREVLRRARPPEPKQPEPIRKAS
jgi:hypothetical protein